MKKKFALFAALAMAAVSAFSLAACKGGDTSGQPETVDPPPAEEPDGEEGEYAVTLGEYNEEGGTITLSAPAEGEKYADGEAVTVTATPKQGYETAAIYVDGEVRCRLSDTYGFLVGADAVVGALFYQSAGDLPEITGVTFARGFRGWWISETGKRLYIGENKLSYGGEAVSAVTPRNSDDEQSYNFALGGKNYSLAWADFKYAVGYMISLLDMSAGTNEYFRPDPMPKKNTAISGPYIGEWETTDDGGEVITLDIKSDSITFNGVTVTDFVDGGYLDSTKESPETSISVGQNIYIFSIGPNVYILIWNKPAGCPMVGEYVFGGVAEELIDQSFRGVWKSADGSLELEIGENSVSLGGEKLTAHISGGTLAVDYNGRRYEAGLYSGNDKIMELTCYSYDNGIISGVEHRMYFVAEDLVSVSPQGLPSGSWSTAEKDHTLEISEGVISLDGVAAVKIAAGEQGDNGYRYVLIFNDTVYTLSYLDYSGGEGEADWHMTLSGDYEYEFFAAE